MPRKYFRRKRRGGGRRRFRKSKIYRAVKKYTPTVLPTTLTTRLKYVDWIDLTMGNGISGTTPAVFAFSTNSAYDPNVTGVGHQPNGWDQLANLYARYQVLGSKIKIRAQCASSSTGAIIGCMVSNSPTISSLSVANMLEQKTSSTAKFVVGTVYGNPSTYLTHTWSFRKETKGTAVGQSYSAAINADPAIQNYYLVWMGPMNAADTTGKVNFYVEIEYIVKFFDFIQLAQS